MKRRLFPALFIILFMMASFVMAGSYISEAYKKTESPNWDNLMYGTWAPAFEKSLNEIIPIFEPSRSFWGSTEYKLFHEGRKGVLVGKDGWLFTDEEFSCLPHAGKNLEQNLAYIAEIKKTLEAKNVRLAIVLIPSKARVYEDRLGTNIMPECRKSLYADILNSLGNNGIQAVGLLDVFGKSEAKDALFLKTDTHWTTEGAKLAAATTSSSVDTSSLTKKNFASKEADGKTHSGDLLRYLPGVQDETIKPDTLKAYTLEEQANAEGQDDAAALFGDDVPPMTLVGTSYSANPLWNFHGFLKEAFQADILNAADEGLGPFTVMDKYINGDALNNTPPALIIWEMPERYFTTKSGFLDKKKDPKDKS